MTSTDPAGSLAMGGLSTFWTQTPKALGATLGCGTTGLDEAEAERRLQRYGSNSDAGAQHVGLLRTVLRRVMEPLSLMLLAAGVVSVATGDAIGGSIIMGSLVLSIGLDTLQEGQAAKAADVLRRSVALKAEVKRNGAFGQIDAGPDGPRRRPRRWKLHDGPERMSLHRDRHRPRGCGRVRVESAAATLRPGQYTQVRYRLLPSLGSRVAACTVRCLDGPLSSDV